MKIRLPMMIQDPKLSGYQHLKRIVERPYFHEASFSDGPACPRLAVFDLNPLTGMTWPAVPFTAPSGDRKLWRYPISNEKDIYSSDFMAVSAFGTVLRTLHMFEEADTLGRPLTWAFAEPQLLIWPRAGEMAQAFYVRALHSLKFHYISNPKEPTQRVYTCLSRDIVCHETGHAVLDGIAPRLWDAITPQSRAIHETVADLTAVVMSFRSGHLREAILNETGGSIDNVRAFSSIGEEFGQVHLKLDCLRDLRNTLRMDQVDPGEAYALSEVLSAALYKMIIGIYQRKWQELSGEGAALNFSLSGKALAIAVEHFKRMIFRSLDYLPPAEVSFIDYARAIIAADQASHPKDEQERGFIREEFSERGIVQDAHDLDVETDFERPELAQLDLAALVSDDGVAQDFAKRNRELLSIPEGVPFNVEPRLDVTKLYYHKGGQKQRVRECLFKVWWRQLEQNPLGNSLPEDREISVGTTLAIDWETKRVRALLTSDRRARPEEAEAQRSARDAMLRCLVETGELREETQVDVSGNILRAKSIGNKLR